ncbi:MAG: CRISPR-associated protein Cas4 [Clostridiales bacterium]|jgi:CRISPR-associated exonuclease Cas4|nr:CRISPR-associated protein Cas4 [Clostridiales bacterium]
MTVTGHIFGYYYICKRKVWFAAHRINMENGSELVALGKLLDETSYKREEHGISVEDFMNIDYLKNNIIHEIKKSDKQSESSVAQVKFYLYHLHLRGLDLKGRLDFPLQKKSVEVLLDEKDLREIPETIKEVERIIDGKRAPDVANIKACKACAYYDLCMI